eukprot:GILI01032434.1.p1 GENE.GILI01032434.1~~GILI01032434.1.p1  ORF type:complete len:102 (-),score=9.08 GILI01032434.1:253-519(-)
MAMVPLEVQRPPKLRFHPGTAFCPSCNTLVQTKIDHRIGALTYLASCGLCMIGCGLCFWIPCVVNECQDVEHFCSRCNNSLDVVNRIS